MDYTNEGYISFFTTMASGALPVEDVIIHVTGADENNRYIEYSLITDRDGKTESISLPAPAGKYSLSPNPTELPYASYRIEAIKEGFYTSVIDMAAVFAGISGELQVNMIPIAMDTGFTKAPDGNLNFDSGENERL